MTIPAIPPSEFSRMQDIRQIDAAPLRLFASAAECAGLAARFDLVAIHRLEAEIELEKQGTAVIARGTLRADIVQSCAISAEDLPVAIKEPLMLRFVPAHDQRLETEMELDAGQLDETAFTGTAFDIGEAVAQSLFLAIDPFREGPDAERVRREVLGNAAESGPFAALAKLRGKPV